MSQSGKRGGNYNYSVPGMATTLNMTFHLFKNLPICHMESRDPIHTMILVKIHYFICFPLGHITLRPVPTPTPWSGVKCILSALPGSHSSKWFSYRHPNGSIDGELIRLSPLIDQRATHPGWALEVSGRTC